VVAILMRREDGFEIDTSPGRLDVARVHGWLCTDAYWALGRPADVVVRRLAGARRALVTSPTDKDPLGSRALP
jgi:hypothetical protein